MVNSEDCFEKNRQEKLREKECLISDWYGNQVVISNTFDDLNIN